MTGHSTEYRVQTFTVANQTLALNTRFIYSQHPKSGLSGFGMVTNQTLFCPVFECLAAILFLPFENQTEKFGLA